MAERQVMVVAGGVGDAGEVGQIAEAERTEFVETERNAAVGMRLASQHQQRPGYWQKPDVALVTAKQEVEIDETSGSDSGSGSDSAHGIDSSHVVERGSE